MTNGSLMKVENIAECSPWSILQYFWPALSDNWSWESIFSLFESGRFTQVLLCANCTSTHHYIGVRLHITLAVGGTQTHILYGEYGTQWIQFLN